MARRNQWASEAALQALVRFGPEESGLAELQRQAGDQLRSSVGQAKGTSRGIVNAVGEARPQVAEIYDRAGLEQARTAHTLQGDTAGLGSVADSIKAGVSLEQTTGLRHLQEGKADALTGLSERAVAAREGQKWGIQKAQQDFAKAITQVLQRKIALGREKGAFTASTAMQLEQADMDREQQLAISEANLTQQERNSLRSAGVNPDTGKRDRNLAAGRSNSAGGGGGRGGGGATNEQVAAAQDQVQEALNWARRLRKAGLDRGDVATALANGREAADVSDPATGKPVFNKDGTRKKRGAVPQIKSQLLLSAALDQVFDDHVSRQTAQRLHRRGIRVDDIGLTSFTDWRQRALAYPSPRT